MCLVSTSHPYGKNIDFDPSSHPINIDKSWYLAGKSSIFDALNVNIVNPSNDLYPWCPILPLKVGVLQIAFEAAHHVIFTNLWPWRHAGRNGKRSTGSVEKLGIYHGFSLTLRLNLPHGHGFLTISLTFYSDPPACWRVLWILLVRSCTLYLVFCLCLDFPLGAFFLFRRFLYPILIYLIQVVCPSTGFCAELLLHAQPFYTWPFPKPWFTHSCFCLNLNRGLRKTVFCVKTRVLRENHGLHKTQFYTKTMLYTKPMIYTKTMFFAPVQALFATCRIALSGYLLLNNGWWLETQPPWYILYCLYWSYSPIRDPKNHE
jgi:hypothetical protein